MASTGDTSLRVALMALVATTGVTATFATIGLYADGSYFLLRILNDPGLFVGNSERGFVTALTQIPVLVAVAAGIRDIGVLATTYTASLVLLPTAAWLGALLVQRRGSLFWLFALMWAAVYLVTGVFAVGEYNLTYALVALSASLLLGRIETGSTRALVLLLGIAVVLLRSYESMLFLGPMLAVQAWLARSRAQTALMRRGLVAVAVLHGVGALWAAVSTLTTSNPEQRATALDVGAALANPQLMIALAAVGGVILALLVKPSRVALSLGLMIVVATAAFVFVDPSGTANSYFFARAAVGGLLLVLLGVATWLRYRAAPSHAGGHWWVIPVVVTPVLAVQFMSTCIGFHQRLEDYRGTVEATSGVTPFESTDLDARYVWSWSTPSLSVLLQTDPDQGIIVGPEWPHEPWQPFDPRTPLRPAPRFHN